MTNILVGAITMYIAVAGPLFCDRNNGLTADQVDVPWIAVAPRHYQNGWQCGDWIIITYDDGGYLFARAYDSGGFDGYGVIQPDGSYLPIVADVPQQWASFPGLSTTGRAINVSLIERTRSEQTQTGSSDIPPDEWGGDRPGIPEHRLGRESGCPHIPARKGDLA